MSRFRKLSQTIWHCQYHLAWGPKYRVLILSGEICEEVSMWRQRAGCVVDQLIDSGRGIRMGTNLKHFQLGDARLRGNKG